MLEMSLKTYARRLVFPSLLERGLWRAEQHRVFGPLFPELARLSQLMNTIPAGSLEPRVSEDFALDAFDLDPGSFGGLAGAFEALSDSLDSGDGGDGGGSDGGDGGGGD